MNASIELEKVSFSYKGSENSLFTDLSLSLPGGMTTLVGQNGTGKSTLLLLAGGRILPDSGTVTVNNRDTVSIKSEEDRNRLVSFIYQNMEFETEDTVSDLLPYVYSQGNHDDDTIIDDIVSAFDLKECLGKKFQENSKGDMQKICIAFSLLYGSDYIMMDEPVFALDHRWKEIVLEYLKNFTQKHNVSLYYSIHELDLSVKYSDNALLFSKDKSILMGPSDQILSNELLQEAYQVPMELLYQRESLFREHLIKPLDTGTLSGQNVKVID